VIKIDQEEVQEFSTEIIRLIKTKDMSTGEVLGLLESIRFSFTAAVIQHGIEKEYGLVRVKK